LQHDLKLTGYRFALRPVRMDDSLFIATLRNDRLRAGFLNRGAESAAAQQEWLQGYFERAGDYYFVIEQRVGHGMDGLLAIYNLNADRREAEWGRWVVRDGSFAAVESAWLLYRMAFETLRLESVYCRTIEANGQVVSFHDHCGLLRSPAAVDLVVDGETRSGIEHRLTRRQYPETARRLQMLAARAARQSPEPLP
jgi:RimJ/RimL family protein N-acetyltransferase